MNLRLLKENELEEFISGIQEAFQKGGAVVVINEETNINDLHILYVKVGRESKGVDYKIWETLEKLYPETIIWKTCTPYFD